MLAMVVLVLPYEKTCSGHLLPPTPILNVFRLSDYGAVGDGSTDDSDAFLRAVRAAHNFMNTSLPWHPHQASVIHIPPGRYVLTKTVQLYPDDPPNCTGLSCVGWRELMISVMGAGVDASTVILPPSTDGFGDASKPTPLFVTHPPARLFNNGQRLGYSDFAIEIGAGNPGTVAVRHAANNVNGVSNLRISTATGSTAAVGIDFPIFLGGLALFTQIEISGFGVCINVSQPQDILAAEHLTLSKCGVGIALRDKGLAVRRLSCALCTAGITTQGSSASLTLLDSTFSAPTGLTFAAAVVSRGGQLFVRNVTTIGYIDAVRDYASNRSDATYTAVATPVGEHSHADAARPFASAPRTSTALPIRETPQIPYPATSSGWTVVNLNASLKDNSPVIQAAIDNGAAHIMLNGSTPNTTNPVYYRLQSTVILRNAVQRLHGGWLKLSSDRPGVNFPTFRVDATTHGSAVVIEVVDLWGVQHNSPTDVLLRRVGCGLVPESPLPCYANTATGDAFFESVNFGGNLAAAAQTVGVRLGPTHQNVWARALDIEGWSNHILSHGSTLWTLGLKFGETEGKPYVRSVGGQLELLGGLLNSFSCQNNNASLQPCQAFHLLDTDATLAGLYTTETGAYENATVMEWCHGVEHQMSSAMFPPRWTWWPSSNVSAPDWLRVGYHLPFYRSGWAASGPTSPPTPPTPAPPPPPPPAPPTTPISAQCQASLNKYCPGSKGGGRVCEMCLHDHTAELEKGGCAPAKDGSFYNIIKPWCGL